MSIDSQPEENIELPGATEGNDPLLASTIDNKYQIISKIAQGAFGSVYKANNTLLHREVAIKFLHTEKLQDPKARERFLLESKLVAALQHQNIVQVYSQGSLANGQLFIVMDFVEGEELSALIAREKMLSLERCVEIFQQVLEGLSYAHSKGIIHRDISPQNIFISKNDSQLNAKILDFGIAKDLFNSSNLSLTATGAQLGKSDYMSPEQCRGDSVDARSDLYSLACVIYQCLFGKTLFAGSSDMEIMYKQIHKSLTSSYRFKGVSADLKAFLTKALQKEPKSRFQSADEMKTALLSCRSAGTNKSWNFSFTALLLGTSCVLALIIGFAFLQKKSEPGLAKALGKRTFEHASDLANAMAVKLERQGTLDLDSAVRQEHLANIETCKEWIDEHLRQSKIVWREIGQAEETLALEYSSVGQYEEAYDAYGRALKYQDNIGFKKKAHLLYRRALAAQSCQRYKDAI
ncbi:MAG: serine/threonine protein kinase, partial [Candidatus Obscuribacterales bacterium]|nr:serine/threonine protein kinase [Candidatus Obscuribacterales bacterium]